MLGATFLAELLISRSPVVLCGGEHGEHAHRRQEKCEPGAGHLGLGNQLLGMEHDRPTVHHLCRRLVVEQRRGLHTCRDADSGRVTRSDRRRSLTDRFGGRTMFIAVSVASIARCSRLGRRHGGPYPLLLVWLLLGVAGTIFAVGIPFANSWFEASRRGFATGVFGMGMVGTALSAFFTPRFVRWFGLFNTHVIIAVALALTAVACIFVMRNSPVSARTPVVSCRSWLLRPNCR